MEYLVSPATDQHPEGIISFLEVNTRLQVEHPVTEVTSGIDLVREQFRIAAGERLRFDADPQPHGHAIEFRINGEDAAANFMPAPGTIADYVEPAGPGVRVDSGVRAGSIIGGQFDSMLAKLIVSGEDRTEAIERARRALDEYVVTGIPTVIPFHKAVLRDDAFVGDGQSFDAYTRWIEEEWKNDLAAGDDAAQVTAANTAGAEASDTEERRTFAVEVNGRRIEVALPSSLIFGGAGRQRPKKRRTARTTAAASGDAVTAPMQGTVIKVNVAEGEQVEEGDLIVVLEAMKMENPVKAHKSGTVTSLAVDTGQQVNKAAVLMELK